MFSLSTLFVVGVVAGCSSGTSFTLHLSPVTAVGQAPFDDLDTLDLVLTPEVGEPLRVTLGAPVSGATPEVTGLPALENTRITVEGYRDDVRVMRGTTEPLTASSGTVEATVFVANTEATAWLADLTEPSWLQMLVPLGSGRFWLAGGAGNTIGGVAEKGLDVVYTLNLAPPDGLAFIETDELPAYQNDRGNSERARAGATFTVLTASGTDQGKVLVTGGGEAHPFATNGVVTDAVSLYDPATDTWEELDGNLEEPRAVHLALENTLGNVVIFGGMGSDLLLPNTIEFYNRAARSFLPSLGSAPIGAVGAVGADLGSDGTLLCGGIEVNDDGSTWTSNSGCVQVSLDGSTVTEVENLPAGVAGAAMIALEDGRVLLTGGATPSAPVSNRTDAPATASAWLYNANNGHWGALSAPMNMSRAGHRMVLLEDARVLIIGGAESYNIAEPPSDPLSCLEIYEPTDGSFTAIDGCDPSADAGGLPGRAYLPAVAYDPDYGVLIVGGLGPPPGAQAGVALFVPAL